MYNVQVIKEAAWDGLGSFMGGVAVQDMLKSLEAGSGVDAAAFTQGRALQYESLDNVLYTSTVSMTSAALWRAIRKNPIHATIDQYDRRTSFGDQWGMAVAESSNPANHISAIMRAYSEVAYYRSYREVSDVSLLVQNIANPELVEEVGGTESIIQRLNRDFYWADRSVIGTRVNGFYSLASEDANSMVGYDAAGTILTGREDFEGLAADIVNAGGTLTHAFANPLVVSDLSAAYATAERVVIMPGGSGGDAWPGTNPAGIDTAQGRISFERDPFNRIGWACPSAVEGDANRPSAPTSVAAAAAGTGGTIPTGSYWYKVTAVNENGQSVGVAMEAAVAVTLGEKVTLTITNGDASAAATGYFIYRSEKDAATAADCRFLWQTPITDGVTTAYIDTGYWVPGTSHVLMLGLGQTEVNGANQQWSQLLPLTKKPLAQTGPTRPFLMNLYGTLRVARPEWCAVYRNILPRKTRDAGWDPLGAYAA
jgi:hypothetical protein